MTTMTPTLPTNRCAVCMSQSTNSVHSVYMGETIEVCQSWITTTKHYHAGSLQAKTLAGIKAKIRQSKE